MSQQDKIFENFPVVPDQVTLQKYLALPILEGPQSVTSVEIDSSVANPNNITFNVQPVPGSLISPLLLATFNMTVNVSTVDTGLAANAYPLSFGELTCFSDYPLMSLIQDTHVVIDGATVNEETAEVWPIRKNFIDPEHEKRWMHLQPTARDTLLIYDDCLAVNSMATSSPFFAYGGQNNKSRGWYIGDVESPLSISSNQQQGATPAVKTASFTIQMTSPLLISPFSEDPNQPGYDVRNRMSISLNLKNTNSMNFLKNVATTGIKITSISFSGVSACKLRVFYYNPPVSRPLADRSSRTFKTYTRTQINLPNVPTAGGITTLTSPSVNLGVTPERLIVAARKQVANYNCNEPDIYLPLQSVSVNYDNQSNLLSNCSVDQYFNMTRESGYNVDYPTFSGKVLGDALVSGTLNILPTTCSPYVFQFSKHIPNRAFLSPNSIQNVNASVKCVIGNQSAALNGATGYELVVLYEHLSLLVFENGQGITFDNGLFTRQDNVDASSKTVEAESSMSGGYNFMVKSMRKMKNGDGKMKLMEKINELERKVGELSTGSGKASGKASGQDYNNALIAKLKNHK